MDELEEIDDDLGDRAVELFLIFVFNSCNFPRSINGISFLSIASTHAAQIIYVVLYRCGKFSLQMLSSHTLQPHLSHWLVILAASHISQGVCIRLLHEVCCPTSCMEWIPYLYMMLMVNVVVLLFYTHGLWVLIYFNSFMVFSLMVGGVVVSNLVFKTGNLSMSITCPMCFDAMSFFFTTYCENSGRCSCASGVCRCTCRAIIL